MRTANQIVAGVVGYTDRHRRTRCLHTNDIGELAVFVHGALEAHAVVATVSHTRRIIHSALSARTTVDSGAGVLGFAVYDRRAGVIDTDGVYKGAGFAFLAKLAGVAAIGLTRWGPNSTFLPLLASQLGAALVGDALGRRGAGLVGAICGPQSALGSVRTSYSLASVRAEGNGDLVDATNLVVAANGVAADVTVAAGVEVQGAGIAAAQVAVHMAKVAAAQTAEVEVIALFTGFDFPISANASTGDSFNENVHQGAYIDEDVLGVALCGAGGANLGLGSIEKALQFWGAARRI